MHRIMLAMHYFSLWRFIFVHCYASWCWRKGAHGNRYIYIVWCWDRRKSPFSLLVACMCVPLFFSTLGIKNSCLNISATHTKKHTSVLLVSPQIFQEAGSPSTTIPKGHHHANRACNQCKTAVELCIFHYILSVVVRILESLQGE